ncbi:hypothetical protein CPB86DRAFT_423627 [Serendipita vermifera]|nr:hypothetical protein CPB86DRAFT_423627 [Serendipita vermifera]
MATMIQSASRPRPTIHFAAAPQGDFQFPHALRKRKRSTHYSSDDDSDPHILTHLVPSRSPPPPRPSRTPSGDDSDSHHIHKKSKRSLHIESGMGGLSLHPNPPQGQDKVSPLSATSTLSSQAESSSTVSLSGYGTMNSTNTAYYMTEPELLEVDEAFMPRDHSDDEIITPDIEESPLLPSLNWKRIKQEDTKMHGASWYEPEKDQPEDQTNGVQIMSSEATPYWDEEEKCFKPFKVSPAYLSRPPPLPLPILRQVDEVEEMSSSDDQTQAGMVVDAMELDE